MKNSGEEPAQQQQVTFQWDDIVKGTQNFGESNLLGEGSFGQVYRCNLPGNTVGAAKLSEFIDSGSQTEFDAEITTLRKANHPNVIRLLGKSLGTKLCLVYEFMPNRSLDHHLFGQSNGLDWNKRMRIAVGVAEALVYVHNVLRVIHRDVKSLNVLLDADFVPKLSDFGSAISFVVDENNGEMVRDVISMKGTPGFMAPEIDEGKASTKSDVYSYGVFLLQIISGKEAFDTTRPSAAWYITDWLETVTYSDDDMHQLIDPKLGNRFSIEGLKRVFETAKLCIKTEPSERPSMDLVEEMVRQALTHPVPDVEIPTRV